MKFFREKQHEELVGNFGVEQHGYDIAQFRYIDCGL